MSIVITSRDARGPRRDDHQSILINVTRHCVRDEQNLTAQLPVVVI